MLEKKEVFVGLNGVKIGKESGMRAGLYNSPSPAPQQRRKEHGRRTSVRRRPSYLTLVLIAGTLSFGLKQDRICRSRRSPQPTTCSRRGFCNGNIGRERGRFSF
jgi:hypothetical protein